MQARTSWLSWMRHSPRVEPPICDGGHVPARLTSRQFPTWPQYPGQWGLRGASRAVNVSLPFAPAEASGRRRSTRLSIGAWLILVFALVIGAFAVATGVSLHGTRRATTDLARMQQEFEPLSRSVRDLGDGLAAFDRAVLASLRADTPSNRDAAYSSAEHL